MEKFEEKQFLISTVWGKFSFFENREEECKELVSRFAEMDLIRVENTFEDVTRNLCVPLCVGLPRLGKIRFA